MDENKLLKIFVLDPLTDGYGSWGDSLSLHLDKESKKKGYKTELKIIGNENIVTFPKGYDCFIIHLRNTTEKALKTLSVKQQNSAIYVISRSGGSYDPIYIDQCFDRFHFLKENTFENIIFNTIQYHEGKKHR